ncbi:MAG TPA: ABC transporter permease [Blastocatellia bacterium]|nr:ABC transporter permease [Blastocatellia bacterium]
MRDWRKEIRQQLAALQLEPAREAEIVEELSQHLEDRYAELRADGATKEEAYRAALVELSDNNWLSRELRRVERAVPDEPVTLGAQRRSLMADLWHDLRYASRMLRHNLGFSLIAVLTLALGIGANTAIFSVINGVLLRPLAFNDPDRLIMLWTDNPAYQLGVHEFPPANSDLSEWRIGANCFEQIAALETKIADLSDDGDPERIGGIEASVNLLPLLGVQPMLGRQFLADEEQRGKDNVAIISYALWQRRFGGDAEIIGKPITINRRRRTIIAVMPEGFNFPRATEMPRLFNMPEAADLWTPLSKNDKFWQSRTQRGLIFIGRLKAGLTQAQAQAEMDSIAARQARDYPQTHEGWSVWLTPLFNQIVGQTRAPLLVLLFAVGFLLLIACANIASLLLARAAARRQEMAVRAAIGAGRARIIRQLLTESFVLAALGGGFGLLFGYLGLKVLLSFIPPNVPRLQNISLDAHVFFFTALVSILTGVLFGLVPAWQASKVNLAEALKDAGRSNSGGRGIRSHSLLVTAEVALVAILLVGAVLMLQSFQRLMAVDPGFNPQGVATFQVCLPWSHYSEGEQRDQFFEQARSQLSSLPGVHAVGAVSQLPLSGNESMSVFSVEGADPVPHGKEPMVEDRVITPGYFDAMGVSFVSGRDFNEADRKGKMPVVIVNEQLARQFFPEGDCIGKRIKRTLDDKDWKTIIGVVRDVRGFALEVQARPQFYHPHAQDLDRDEMSMVLRADQSALPSLRSAIQQEFKQLDATVPLANYRTMQQLVSNAVARPRFITLLLGLFAATALLLTVVGLYGVVAYGVNQRTREIGIRMALGAQRQNVLALVIRQGMQPALVGLVIGMAGAFVLMRSLASQLYEVKAGDPLTFILVALSLLLIACAACYVPARRATKIDPMVALRYE